MINKSMEKVRVMYIKKNSVCVFGWWCGVREREINNESYREKNSEDGERERERERNSKNESYCVLEKEIDRQKERETGRKDTKNESSIEKGSD